MSRTIRDKDFHKLRNSDRYFGKFWRDCHVFQAGLKDRENSESETQYDKIWSKYGRKSMVGNKRRRCTSRKSNQKNKQVEHQINRAKEKMKLKLELKDIIQNEL